MNQKRPFVTPIRALAFDVDGTIADTDPIHAEAWARALKTVNGRQFKLSEYLDACVNGAMTPRQFLSQYYDARDWPAIEAEKRRIYPDLMAERISLTAGLAELLSAARLAGVRVAIVSSSSRESVAALLRGSWKGAPPDIVIARGDAEASKPNPAPYEAAVYQLNTPSKYVVAFEDSASGVASARGAGLICVQVGLSARVLSELRIRDFGDCVIERVNCEPQLTVYFS